MAKPNYQFEKRQKDLAKQRKKQEKEQEKAARKAGKVGEVEPEGTTGEPGTAAPSEESAQDSVS